MISFYCNCGQLMTVRDDFAGRQGNCPRCRAPFTVPAQSQAQGQAPGPGQAPPGTTSREAWDSSAVVHAAEQARQAQQQQGLATPSAGPTATLEVVHGPPAMKGKTFKLLPGPTVLGRDPGADLTVQSDRVSRRHCQFDPTGDGRYAIVDLGSANGTLVNQSRINGRKMLTGGEYIQTGDCLFRYNGG